MPDNRESSHVLALERRATGIAFLRALATAIGLHSVTLIMEIGVTDQSLAKGVGVVLTLGLIFALWAAVAPRGAAVVLLVLLFFGLLSVVVGSVGIYRDQGLAIMTLFAVIAIPCEVFAVAFAWRARPLAKSYREVRRRLRSSRREDRILAGCGF